MLKKLFTKNNISKLAIATIAVVGIIAFNLGSAAEVRVETVVQGNIKELIKLQGKVELDKNEKIYARLEGFVDEINAIEGDLVDENTKLLQLSVEDVNYAISKSEAAYAVASAQLESLKKSIRPEHVKLAEAELEQAKAIEKMTSIDYNNKKSNYERIKQLYVNGAISQKDMEDAEVLLAEALGSKQNAEQVARMAQYKLELTTAGVLKEEIKAAEANAKVAKIQMEELVYNKGKTNVYSSIKGIVLSKEVEKDQAVLPGTLMYEIGDYNSAYIKVEVLVDDIAKIDMGQKATISGDVLKDGEIPGEVYYIAPRAVSKLSSLGLEQQRIEVRIKFDNTSLKLKPGYTIDVDIISQEKTNTLYVSDKSVFEMNGKDNVFIVKNNRIESRIVETGIGDDDYIEVLSGIAEGETIVVDPDSTLKPGEKIKFKNKY